MTNFNPDEQRSLMALLSGLQGGMTGSSGMSALQGILGQQQSRLAARDERMGSLIDLITSAAGQGQSLEAAQSLAGAYTAGSNIPPRIEDALGSLYPDPGIPGAPSVPSQFGGVDAAPNPAMQQSPVYMPPQQPPMTPQDQYASAQASASMQTDPLVGQSMADEAASLIGTSVGGDGTPTNPGTPITEQNALQVMIQSPGFQAASPVAQQTAIQALQAILATPHGTAQVGIDQSGIGGFGRGMSAGLTGNFS